MSITPDTPDWSARGGFKHGSILNGNLCPYRVTSQRKSTTKDYIATLRTNALVAFSLIHGTAAGNIVELAAARMQINDITESEEDGIQMWTLDVACTVDVGSDDFTISSR